MPPKPSNEFAMQILSLFHSKFRRQGMILGNQNHHALLPSFSSVFSLSVFCFSSHSSHSVTMSRFWSLHSYGLSVLNWIHSSLISKRRASDVSISPTSFHFFVKGTLFGGRRLSLCRDVHTKYFVSFSDPFSAMIRVLWGKSLRNHQYNPIQ